MKISFVLLCFLIEEKQPCIDVRGCDRYNHNKHLEQQMRGIIKLHGTEWRLRKLQSN